LSKLQDSGSSSEKQELRLSAINQAWGAWRGIFQLLGIPLPILLILLEHGYILET
jgi:hypothetical protein